MADVALELLRHRASDQAACSSARISLQSCSAAARSSRSRAGRDCAQPCHRTHLFRPLGRIEIPDIFASIDPMLPDRYSVHWQFHLRLHRSAHKLSQSKYIRDENRICARVSVADLLVSAWSCQWVKHKIPSSTISTRESACRRTCAGARCECRLPADVVCG